MVDVLDYEFRPLKGAKKESKVEGVAFHFEDFDSVNREKNREHDRKIIKGERELVSEKRFLLSPIVREHRGHKAQAEEEYELKIQEEVERRVELVYEQAYQKGFDQGFSDGKVEIQKKMKLDVEQKVQLFSEYLEVARNNYSVLLSNQKSEIYDLIRNLTKWVTLKELKDDGDYLKRLLEKLIIEIKSNSELLIQVSSEDFSKMPEVLEAVSLKLGELKNVRVEIDHAISDKGIIVSSENGMIIGTLEQQLNSIDKLFSTLGQSDA